MTKQSIRAALEKTDNTFDRLRFKNLLSEFGIDREWGCRAVAKQRVAEIKSSGSSHGAWLVTHHAGEELKHARHFLQHVVAPYPSVDYAGVKKIWSEFPLRIRCRLEPVFAESTRFSGIEEIEEQFDMWEAAYLRDFASIDRTMEIIHPKNSKKRKADFHEAFVTMFYERFDELEQIIEGIQYLAKK